MFEAVVSLWAVVAAAAAYFVVGALWYSPLLFAKPWMQALGMKEKDMEDGPHMSLFIYTFILIFVLTYILAHALQIIGAVTIFEGLVVGAWLWVGFVLTTMVVNGLYSGQPRELILINSGYHLVGILVAASVLTIL